MSTLLLSLLPPTFLSCFSDARGGSHELVCLCSCSCLLLCCSYRFHLPPACRFLFCRDRWASGFADVLTVGERDGALAVFVKSPTVGERHCVARCFRCLSTPAIAVVRSLPPSRSLPSGLLLPVLVPADNRAIIPSCAGHHTPHDTMVCTPVPHCLCAATPHCAPPPTTHHTAPHNTPHHATHHHTPHTPVAHAPAP